MRKAKHQPCEAYPGFKGNPLAIKQAVNQQVDSSDCSTEKLHSSGKIRYSIQNGMTVCTMYQAVLCLLCRYVRTKLAGQMRLRMMPEIRFMNDDAAERGEQVGSFQSCPRASDCSSRQPTPQYDTLASFFQRCLEGMLNSNYSLLHHAALA